MNQNLQQKFVLGTANFGMPYGSLAEIGSIPQKEIEKILQTMIDNNLFIIDTAQSYGNAESVLGDLGMQDFQVNTKFSIKNGENISDKIEMSLKNLKIHSLESILIHNAEFLPKSQLIKCISALKNFQKDGIVKKIGISIYEPCFLERFAKTLTIDICQAPVNILNKQFLSKKSKAFLNYMGAELHARSVFLQGVLLMNKQEYLNFFSGKFLSIFEEYNLYLKNLRVSKLEFCLGWVLKQQIVSKIPIGVESASQLSSIIEIIEFPSSESEFTHSEDDELRLLSDPRNWK